LRDRIFELKGELDEVTKEEDSLWSDFFDERSQNLEYKNRWAISEEELEETNKLLKNENSTPLSSDDLYKLANNFYRKPSRYIDIIKTMRHRMGSEKTQNKP
jgi:hypothetical protein